METLNTQSVIPNTIPSTLVPIIVSTAGENGIDKSVFSPRQSTGMSLISHTLYLVDLLQ